VKSTNNLNKRAHAREREREKQRNVIQTQKVSTQTDNLETGQPFKHNIQRRVSYKSFVESKWWGSSVSKKFSVSI